VKLSNLKEDEEEVGAFGGIFLINKTGEIIVITH